MAHQELSGTDRVAARPQSSLAKLSLAFSAVGHVCNLAPFGWLYGIGLATIGLVVAIVAVIRVKDGKEVGDGWAWLAIALTAGLYIQVGFSLSEQVQGVLQTNGIS